MMVLDMANSYVSSATVRVKLDTGNTSSSSTTTSTIHKEKFNVSLSGKEHNDLFNSVKHLKIFIGLAEIAKSE